MRCSAVPAATHFVSAVRFQPQCCGGQRRVSNAAYDQKAPPPNFSSANGAKMAPTTVSKSAALTAAAPKKPTGVNLFSALMFNGPAPEIINGRLAMCGLLIAASREAESGEMFLSQLQHAPVQEYLVVLLWVYASLVPILKGARSEAFGIFSPRAEVTNSRAAMLGFACILILEWKSGVPFF